MTRGSGSRRGPECRGNAGAVEILTKPFGEQELLDSVELALARDRVTHAQRAESTGPHALYEMLTPKEREVMALVMRGMLNKRRDARHARDHRENASRPGDAEDAGLRGSGKSVGTCAGNSSAQFPA